jgi:EmrB/QacA subfamily drug resistance transporter
MERRWRVLLLISIGSFMAFLDAPIVSVALPAIHKSFVNEPSSTIAWVLDAYFIAFAAPLVVFGKLADRFGRRTVFVSGLSLFGIASVACGAAPSIGLLIAARVIQGTAAAMVVPAGQGLMLDEFSEDQRKTAIGILAAIVGLATAISPAIGGLIVDGLGWRWIFYINVGGAVAAVLWAMSLLQADVRQRGAPLPDGLGAGLQAAAVALLCLAILKSSTWGLTDARTIGALLLAIAAFAWFLSRARTHPAPVLDLTLFRSRVFAFANASSLVFAIGFYGSMINGVLYLTSVWHYSILKTGLAFLSGSLFGAFWGRPAGQAAERYGPGPVIFIGSLLSGTGMLAITLSTGSTPHYVSDWLPGQLALGAGTVITLTGLVGGALTSAPPRQFALASGINSAIRQIGAAIGVALVAAILTDATPANLLSREHSAFAVCVAALFAGGCLAPFMRARVPAHSLAKQSAKVDMQSSPAVIASSSSQTLHHLRASGKQQHDREPLSD